MRRRDFISLLSATSVVWPLALHAQLANRMRRIGVLMLYPENDPEGQIRAVAFRESLEKLGWTVGHSLQIDYRWGVGDSAWIRSAAEELLRLAPDVILANGGPAMRPVQQTSQTVPIVFIGGSDVVADGFVQSLARPGGNMTGFTTLESSIGGKLLQLLKEIAPQIKRVAVMFNRDNLGSVRLYEFAAASAQTFAVEVIAAPIREAADIEAAMTGRERGPVDGLIVTPDPTTNTYRKLIVELAARYQLPTIYALRAVTVEGGLASYGVSVPDLFRQAATYVDRILRGERPADLPVQQPTKFELVINMKTAKALGIAFPPSILIRADEVIE